jgi:ankyrin repeat protein
MLCLFLALPLVSTKAGAGESASTDRVAPLLAATQRGDHEEVLRLLASGTHASAANRYGIMPLAVACERGDEVMVRALLKAKADVNATLNGGESMLMIASRTGIAAVVKALLDGGAKVEARDRKGQSALMWAAAEGNVDVVEMLVKAGADVHAKVKSGFTPMLFAVREGRIDVVKVVVKAGVDVNVEVTQSKSMSPLLLAIENGHFELAVALLDAGADANDQRSGFTPLHAITWVRKPNRGDDEAGNPPPQGSGRLTSLQLVRELVKRGAKVDSELHSATPFMMASKTADLPLMKLLLELGADPKLTNHEGATALMFAAGLGTKAPDEEAGTEEECIEAVKLLLDLGLDVNAVSKTGETAMHGAAYKSLPMMVAFLTEKGAKIDVWNHKNKRGWTPIMIAEGFRQGNFKPSAETLEALHKVLRDAGLPVPPPTPRTDGGNYK